MGQSFQVFETEQLNTETYFDDLGKSFDSAFLEKRKFLLDGTPIQESARPASNKDIFFYEFTSDQRDFSRRIKASASGKASFGLGKFSASASFNKFFSSNSYSCYIFGYMKLVEPRWVFNLRKTKLEPNIEKFIINNQTRNVDLIEREIGDEVIDGVTLSSEILVKMEIQTKSETQKESIKVSASASGSYGSGTAKFSSLYEKFSSSKKITIDVYGNIPNQFLANTSPEEVDKLLLDFPNRSQNNFSIMEFSTTPVYDIPQFLNFKRIINGPELSERRLFLANLDALYQDLIDWENDILYVISDLNKAEFSDETKKIALEDKNSCEDYKNALDNVLTSASDFWKENGRNADKFKLDLLSAFPKEFPIYPRIEPPVVVSVPTPVARKPKPKPRREPSDNRGSMGAANRH